MKSCVRTLVCVNVTTAIKVLRPFSLPDFETQGVVRTGVGCMYRFYFGGVNGDGGRSGYVRERSERPFSILKRGAGVFCPPYIHYQHNEHGNGKQEKRRRLSFRLSVFRRSAGVLSLAAAVIECTTAHDTLLFCRYGFRHIPAVGGVSHNVIDGIKDIRQKRKRKKINKRKKKKKPPV